MIAVGKINDIFNGQGITEAIRTKSNMDGVDQLLTVMNKEFTGLSFTNLVDFDALYGHRRDVRAMQKPSKILMVVCQRLWQLWPKMICF